MGLGILTRHRTRILDALASALRGDTQLRAILAYHAGLTDADGQPSDATGKLLRPSLVLFVAEQLGAAPEDALPAAVGLELIHNFSLIHDDIQDGDRIRRGRPTVWTTWGTNEAINAGDLMQALAVRTALDSGSIAAALLLAATEAMIEGQSMDLGFETRFVELSEYLRMIDGKTGALLVAAFELGGAIATADDATQATLRALGRAVGRAFQIQDDLLGIWGNAKVVGKPNASDVRQRKKSYPTVLAFERADGDDRAALRRIYEPGDPAPTDADVDWVIELMTRLGIQETGQATVKEHLNEAARALDDLPFSSEGRRDLEDLIDYLARRNT